MSFLSYQACEIAFGKAHSYEMQLLVRGATCLCFCTDIVLFKKGAGQSSGKINHLPIGLHLAG